MATIAILRRGASAPSHWVFHWAESRALPGLGRSV